MSCPPCFCFPAVHISLPVNWVLLLPPSQVSIKLRKYNNRYRAVVQCITTACSRSAKQEAAPCILELVCEVPQLACREEAEPCAQGSSVLSLSSFCSPLGSEAQGRRGSVKTTHWPSVENPQLLIPKPLLPEGRQASRDPGPHLEEESHGLLLSPFSFFVRPLRCGLLIFYPN